MATFDAKAFAQSLVDGLKAGLPGEAAKLLVDAKDAKAAIDDLQKNVADTIGAMQTETDPVKLQNLKDDIPGALFSSRKSIESIVVTRLSSDGQNVAKTALDITIHVAVTAAKAFILA